MNINDRVKVLIELSNEEKGVILNCILFTQKLYDRIKFDRLDSNIELIREFGHIAGDTKSTEFTATDFLQVIDACTALREELRLENNPAGYFKLEWEEWYLLSNIIYNSSAIKHFYEQCCKDGIINNSSNPLLNALNT